MAAPEVLIQTTSSRASDANFVKMTAFQFQYIANILLVPYRKF